MGARKGATRVTAQDIARAGEGGLPTLIKNLVKKATEGDADTKQSAAAMLSSLASQNHREHVDALFSARVVPPLVNLLTGTSVVTQASAAATLRSIALHQPCVLYSTCHRTPPVPTCEAGQGSTMK